MKRADDLAFLTSFLNRTTGAMQALHRPTKRAFPRRPRILHPLRRRLPSLFLVALCSTSLLQFLFPHPPRSLNLCLPTTSTMSRRGILLNFQASHSVRHLVWVYNQRSCLDRPHGIPFRHNQHSLAYSLITSLDLRAMRLGAYHVARTPRLLHRKRSL